MSHYLNSQKILFLGIMIFAVFFLNRNFEASSPRGPIPRDFSALGKGENSETPLAVLEPVSEESSFHGSVLESAPRLSEATFTPTSVSTPPSVAAAGAILADLVSGEVYIDYESAKRWPLASLTKLVSAAVVLKEMTMNDAVTLEPPDFPLEGDGNGLKLKPGERYTVRDLLKAALLSSNNEAIEALARSYGRSDFIKMMNVYADEWGLRDTFFNDPTGLSAANQSTASDIKILGSELYHNYPEIFRLTQKKEEVLTELNSVEERMAVNINLFVSHPDFAGGKTGYTDEASGNLISIFSFEGRPILVVVLGTTDRFGETEKLFEWFRSTYTLSG